MRFRTLRTGGGILLLLSCIGAMAAAHTTAPPADPVIRQASDFVEWGRWKDARDLLAQSLAAPDPPGQQAVTAERTAFYAHILLQFGQLDQALKLTDKALDLDDACARCHLYRFEAMAQRAKNMSRFRAMLQLPKLKGELQKAEKLDPSLGDVQWAWIDLDLGLPSVLGGSAKDAYVHADRLAKLDPVDGWLARASIANSEKMPDQELTDFRHAAEQDPKDPRGSFALGQALYERKQYREAAAPLAHAYELEHRSALYSGYHAANLARLKMLEPAKTVLTAGQAEHPASRIGDYLVAQALHAVGQDFEWAKQLLARYLAVPPEPGQPTAADARQLLAGLGE